ncbi:MAG TPA: hypothetical protein VNT99_06685, partial [Methylomirabilota bacterium]|nr:hypothetical protein [Methylomirabilota bacterium]
MDRKTVIVLVASFGLLFLWQMLVPKMFPPIPVVRTNGMASATIPFPTNGSPATAASNLVPPPPSVPAGPIATPAITIGTNSPEQREIIETAEAIYTFTSRGGGLQRIELKHYLETVGCERTQGTNQFATLNDARVPLLAVQADNALGDNVFQLTR